MNVTLMFPLVIAILAAVIYRLTIDRRPWVSTLALVVFGAATLVLLMTLSGASVRATAVLP